MKEYFRSGVQAVGLHTVLAVGQLLETTGITVAYDQRNSWQRKRRLIIALGVLGTIGVQVARQAKQRLKIDRDTLG